MGVGSGEGGSADGGVGLDAERRRLWFLVNAYGPRSPKLSDFRPGVGSEDVG